MKTPLEYKIVVGRQQGVESALAELEDQVNLYLSQGWRLHGAITIHQPNEGRSSYACREMVRGGRPPKRWRREWFRMMKAKHNAQSGAVSQGSSERPRRKPPLPKVVAEEVSAAS